MKRLAQSVGSSTFSRRVAPLLTGSDMCRCSSPMWQQRRYLGPRQYAPKGYRDAAGRVPMTPEFGEECNELAKVAHQSKNYGDAITLYDRALAMRRDVHGPIHEKCAATLHNIGRVFLDMKEYGAAENALTEAAAIYEQLDGATSLRYAESLALLALAYTHLKFLDEAEKAYKDAIKVYRDAVYNHKENSWLPTSTEPIKEPQLHPLSSAAHALADCASLFLMRGWEHRAITFLEEALEIRRFLYARHNKYRPMIAQTLNKLAELKKSINDATGAEMAITECLTICIETLGRDNAATAAATSTKASLLVAKKQYREGLKLYEESSTTYAVALGKDHFLFGQELVKLGRAQEFCEEFGLAEKSYRKGIEIVKKAMGPDSLQVAESNTFLGTLLIRKMDIDGAVELLRDAVRIRKQINREDPQLAFLYQKLGEALALRRDIDAEPYFLLSIDRFRDNAKIEPMQRTFLTDVLDDIGLFYLDYGHLDKAEPCFKEALDLRIEVLGQDHATVAYSYSNFALLYLHREDHKNCEVFCQSALDLYQKSAKTNVVAHADVHTTLGQCLHRQKKNKEALASFEKALNIRRIRGESMEMATAESLNHIARVYLSMKDYPKAAKHVHEAKLLAAKFPPEMTKQLRSDIQMTEKQLPEAMVEDTIPQLEDKKQS